MEFLDQKHYFSIGDKVSRLEARYLHSKLDSLVENEMFTLEKFVLKKKRDSYISQTTTRLETRFLDLKRDFQIETSFPQLEREFLDQKNNFQSQKKKKLNYKLDSQTINNFVIGDKVLRFKTRFLDWKRDYLIGNKISRL